MRRASFIPRSIAVCGHPAVPNAMEVAGQIATELAALGANQVYTAPLTDEALRQRVQAHVFDLMIVLGGDGTMLRAGRMSATSRLPILGINMGTFGFLIELQRDQWQDKLAPLLKGQFFLEDRMMVEVEHRRAGKLLSSHLALNEAVVCRGQQVRPIRLNTRLNDYQLADFIADGLIVSTPTGSTAYALAAGGPILPPEQRNILLVPLAPHLSMDRAIVLDGSSEVIIQTHTRHEAVLCIDGQPSIPMEDGDVVIVSSSDHNTTFARFQEPGYFYKNVTKYMDHNPIPRSEE